MTREVLDSIIDSYCMMYECDDFYVEEMEVDSVIDLCIAYTGSTDRLGSLKEFIDAYYEYMRTPRENNYDIFSTLVKGREMHVQKELDIKTATEFQNWVFKQYPTIHLVVENTDDPNKVLVWIG